MVSNILMMLDALLMYEHRKFTEDELDVVEHLIDTTPEHCFHIRERLIAARAGDVYAVRS